MLQRTERLYLAGWMVAHEMKEGWDRCFLFLIPLSLTFLPSSRRAEEQILRIWNGSSIKRTTTTMDTRSSLGLECIHFFCDLIPSHVPIRGESLLPMPSCQHYPFHYNFREKLMELVGRHRVPVEWERHGMVVFYLVPDLISVRSYRHRHTNLYLY